MDQHVSSIVTTAERSQHKGRTLARVDSEQKMLASGPLGAERLVINIALDFMESYPGLSADQAVFAAQAYCARAYG